MVSSTGNISGAQSVRRALDVLRLLALHEGSGMTLQELIAHSGLERSTAHRLASCLVEENFARRDPDTRRYHLGVDAMYIGFSTMHRTPIVETLRPLVKKLTRLTGDTVFVVIQQGDYALCLMREHGDFPVRIFTIDEGEKRLMGMGAGGLAMLAKYEDEDVARIHARHAGCYERNGLALDELLRRIRRTREQGFSEIVDGITPGISGVGYCFPLSRVARAAISFGAISTRLDAPRRQELGALLVAECDAWVSAQASLSDQMVSLMPSA